MYISKGFFMQKHLFTVSFLFSLLLLLTVVTASAEIFKDGQKVCFYGDSITHGGRFHYVMYDYYLTRFPEAKIRFYNAGVAGDTAGGAMTRIEEDVFSLNPDVVILMFGMNDVGRGNYVTNPSEGQLKAQQNALDGYARNMKTLTGMLQEKLHPKFVFITPSPFDQNGENDRNNNQPGCNDGLGKCAEIVKTLAAETAAAKSAGNDSADVEVVDFHAPITAFNLKMQADDPRYTIIGPDRVHPGAPGHLMMAWLFLKEQGAPSLVSEIQLDAAGDVSVVKSENAVVSDVQKDAVGTLKCTVLEKALPFPIDPAAYPVLEQLSIVQDLNQEIFSVKNLAEGNYELVIDGNSVGTFRAEELAAGVNLAMNEKTPQFQQAQRVRTLGEERRATEVILRNYAAVRWYLRRYVNPDDLAAVQDFYDHKIPNRTGYFESKVPGYITNWPQRSEVQAKLDAQTEELFTLRVPEKHTYEIRPVK